MQRSFKLIVERSRIICLKSNISAISLYLWITNNYACILIMNGSVLRQNMPNLVKLFEFYRRKPCWTLPRNEYTTFFSFVKYYLFDAGRVKLGL